MHTELDRGVAQVALPGPLWQGGCGRLLNSLFGSFQDTISLRSPSPRVGLTEVGSSLFTIRLGADLAALCLILVHGSGRQAIRTWSVCVLLHVCVCVVW